MEEVVNNRTSLYGFEEREPDARRSRSRAFNIKQLWQRSHEIIALALQGLKQTEIASILGVSNACVSNTLNSELGMEKLSKLRQERDEGLVDVSRRVAELSRDALDTYQKIFDGPDIDIELKKKTADTVLMDLGGHRAPTKIDARSVTTVATLEEIEKFKQRGLEAARESGMLIEVDNDKSVKQLN